MHSKWKIWDYLKGQKQGLDSSFPLTAFSCFDPLAFKFIKDSIPRDTLFEGKLNVLAGKEITSSWIDDNFLSLGLFGNNESFLILSAEEMSKDVKEKLLECSEQMILDNRFLLLNFLKEDAFYKKIQKMDNINTIKIQEPAFWEYSNLLDFLCKQLGVLLSFEGKEFILNKVSQSLPAYYSLLNQIMVNFPDKNNIDVNDIRPLIKESKIDHFEMASLFGGKKIKAFYQTLTELEIDYNEYRALFFFMQSHLTKVLDPSYLEKKSKLTKYDRQIQAQSRAWNSASLNRSITYFSSLEIKAKRKDPMLQSLLQRDFLRTIL